MGLLIFILFLLTDIFLIRYLKKEFECGKSSHTDKNDEDIYADNRKTSDDPYKRTNE